MQMVFARSEATQKQSMDRISKSMTLDRAVEMIEKKHNTPTLKQITGLLSSKQTLRKHLHDGFGGLNGARLLL